MRWIKLGRIFEPRAQEDWLVTHAMLPFADPVHGNVRRVYFAGRDGTNRSQTGFTYLDVTEPDRPFAVSSEPVLRIGKVGAFDDSGAQMSWLVNYGDLKYLYYTGWNLGVTVPFRNSIGLAISSDGGETFARYSDGPILDRDPCDPYLVMAPCVLIDQGVWRMWYISGLAWEPGGGKPKHFYHVKYSESNDGICWRRTGRVCIDFKSEAEYAIGRPCVVKDQDIYRMWYSYRGTSYRIGYAESKDGLDWDRKDEGVGIDVSDSGWDSEMIEYPFVFDQGGHRYMLYNGNGYGRNGIGLAVLAKEEQAGAE